MYPSILFLPNKIHIKIIYNLFYCERINYIWPLDSNICTVPSEVAHQNVTLDPEQFIVGHGKSNFLKMERVQKMQRENAGAITGGWRLAL